MDLIEVTQDEDTRTENGALTYSTSSDRIVDLFFQVNAMRGRPDQDLISLFVPAIEESPLDAMRVLFYSRDVRGGQGERRAFRVILRHLAKIRPELVRVNLSLIPEYGRVDDLFCLEGTPLEDEMLSLIASMLREDSEILMNVGFDKRIGAGISLAGKWAPSEGSKTYPGLSRKIMKKMDFSPKRYRKMLSALRAKLKVVEKAMCSNDWDGIDYQHVPSYAMKNYRGAFARHTPERWSKYIVSLEKGEAKVNAGTLYPHDLVRPFLNGWQGPEDVEQGSLLNEQWKALPNYMTGNTERVIPVCDVSGSMTGTPMEVSIALGLYVSERNEGPFKDAFITFSSTPTLEVIKGKTLFERVDQLGTSTWGMSTNLQGVFGAILESAVNNNVDADKMPTMVLIFSDMEFDCVSDGEDVTLMNKIREIYEEHGYRLPKVVYWNLRAAGANVPVKFNEAGTALVSGFSPSILEQLLSGNEFSPVAVMRATLDKERYAAVRVEQPLAL